MPAPSNPLGHLIPPFARCSPHGGQLAASGAGAVQSHSGTVPTIHLSIPNEAGASGSRVPGSLHQSSPTASSQMSPPTTPNSRALRSMPNLCRHRRATGSEVSASATPAVNRRRLQRHPVNRQLTIFSQDLLLDGAHQEPGGAWADYGDHDTVVRLTEEAASEVGATHSAQTLLPQHQQALSTGLY
jgi:hypothetical protein